MTSRARIAFVSTMAGSPWGGSEALWFAAAERAVRDGHEVATFTVRWRRTPEPLRRLKDQGVGCSFRPRRSSGIVDRVRERVTPSFADLFRFRPDVVCIAQGGTYDVVLDPQIWRLVSVLIGRRIPYVLVCQCEDDMAALSDWHRDWGRRYFAAAHRVAFLGRTLHRASEIHLAQELPNACVLRNPVNLADRSMLSWPDNGAVTKLACVARLDAMHKCQQVLLAVLSQAVWRSRPWVLNLFGSGAWLCYLEELVRHLGLSDRVRFMGHQADVRSIWREHHVLVMSSWREGVPLAMVEAMLCGRVVVMADAGSISEWVEDGQSGFLADAPTERSFGQAFERAWAARDRWPAIASHAHDRAHQMIVDDPEQQLLDLLLEAKNSR